MRIKKVQKYFCIEELKTAALVHLGFIILSLVSYLLTSLFMGKMPESKSAFSFNGMDIAVMLVTFGVIIGTFKTNMDFSFQNSLSNSSRAWSYYLGQLSLAFISFLISIVLTLLVPFVLYKLKITSIYTTAFNVFSNGQINYFNMVHLFMIQLILAVAAIFMGLTNYHMKLYQIIALWVVIYLAFSFFISAAFATLSGSADNSTPIGYFANKITSLIIWLQEDKSHWLIFYTGIFAIISLIDLLGLYRIQMRRK